MLAAGLLLVCCGCRTTLPHDATTQPVVPRTSNAELMMYIGNQPLLAAEPAYRAVYVLWRGHSFDGEFAALQAELEAGKIISTVWKHTPDMLVRRGDVGYMLCRAGGVRSGVNWQLTGLGRYAWRELVYLRIADGGSELGFVIGGEFLGMLLRTQEYADRSRTTETETIQLGSPPGS